ncbi:MAG TPA: cell division protein [Hydrogenophaga sp.]|jgi:cell division protein FtsI (penicillin-binding protein 3)|uniref:peptidoglycan D,D-transpeptidase FtsI family protein n=1 Tax=Hydrogenophaga sp. TaxID=1904254 RepID=UPI0008C62CE7|nr:penicillin-binding protein 2 [Hydrogenophaga sp.]MBU4183619.1 penicillin-binding protein 2 [Gammaproteobacteria bacterium]OGA75809.1 MAG: cell division protein [Burkholderiales bacterium GWE1_65_30]OGA90209.1 MAG: cell division protein [Burkholderiales bacterium GWF1_66_17]OGB17489.1 MAG: cell division protein [Burkholderiales bacterium RIFCSPHIGHO2_02_FULL_66_10]OGB29533.1 MAG: cell division protein [Burkholderiales bacterium RIFCSPLOWO2_02_FULL_66_35]PKO76939.1 MAG: cell division protein
MSPRGSRSINYSASPLLASKTPVWRSKFIVAALALAFVGLGARAAYVQVFGNDFFQRQGEVRFARTLELPANRGRVLDRNGLILATSVVAQSLWAIPEDVDKADPKLKTLAKLLGLPFSELKKKLANEDKTFVWVQRQVDEPLAKEIAALGIKGIYQTREYKRQYPEGEAAAHVVGFTNVEDRGQEGVELAFNKQLSGRNGSRRVIKDRLGRVVEDVRDVVPPVDGPDLQLSIDSKVQYFAYQKLRDAVLAHKAKAGSVVVLDTQTGEILALANYPSYDPNRRAKLSGEQLRNRVLTDSFEPGSTMKPFIAALALDKGLVRPETQIQTAPGRIMIGGSSIGDAHPHGILTVNEIIQKSSNVGTVKMAMQMHPREMWEIFAQAGFGQKPHVPFPGAVSGRLRPYKTWRPIEQATMSYGYGLSVSLFQLAQAYTIFSRDGELIPVTLLKAETPATGVRVFSEKNAIAVRKMLGMATSPGGTATQAQTMGYSVGGKTGTAHKQEGKGYAAKKYRSFFVGLAPVEAPRIVVAVMVDEPSNGQYYGGLVAAPVFSETVQQTLRILGVQPDMNVKPQIVTEIVEESF